MLVSPFNMGGSLNHDCFDCQDQDPAGASPAPSSSSSSSSAPLTEAVNKSVIPKSQLREMPPPPPPPSSDRPYPPPLSQATPAGRLKQSDSSFGLHSPDNFPVGFNPQEGQVQVSSAVCPLKIGVKAVKLIPSSN